MSKVTLHSHSRDRSSILGAKSPLRRNLLGDEPSKKRDLLSSSVREEPVRRKGRPRKDDMSAPSNIRALEAIDENELRLNDSLIYRNPSKVRDGVNVLWIASLLNMNRLHVSKRLRHLRPVRQERDTPYYDLLEALPCLIEPDIEKFLETVRPEELPEKLRVPFWRSRLDEQKWKRQAGQLWPTEMVMEKFSLVLISIRTMLLLVPDKIERISGISIEQYKVLKSCLDEVLEELAEEVVKLSKEGFTPNQLVTEEGEYEGEEQ